MTSNPRFHRPLWHLVDAKDQILGRMATQVAQILRGKHKPTFTPNFDCGDYVVIINAAEVKMTGRKIEQKKYTWHTGYPGGLKQKTAKMLLQSKPEEIVRKAVMGMFAKNNLRNIIGTKLRVFPGRHHLHLDKLPIGTKSILDDH